MKETCRKCDSLTKRMQYDWLGWICGDCIARQGFKRMIGLIVLLVGLTVIIKR
jgi:hypothetical protein